MVAHVMEQLENVIVIQILVSLVLRAKLSTYVVQITRHAITPVRVIHQLVHVLASLNRV